MIIKILKRKKKILGAVQKLPGKQHSQSSQFSPRLGWIGCDIQQATYKGSQNFFFRFNILILIYFFKYKTIETHAPAFLPLNISAVGSVFEYGARSHGLFSILIFSILLLGWVHLDFLQRKRKKPREIWVSEINLWLWSG